jgi:hypothetical protein
MFEGGRDEGFTPFGTSLMMGMGTRLDGFHTGFAALTPVPIGESYMIKQTGGRDLWMNATAYAASKRGKKRVAIAGLESQPSFGHTMEPTTSSMPGPKPPRKEGKGAGKVKTSLDPSDLMDYEDNTPVNRGHEPHARLTNRIKLQLAGAIV